MPRIRFRDFTRGLFLSHPRDEVPAGTLYRATGIRNPGLTRSLRSRWGSRLLETFPFTRLHSIVTWHDRRYYGGSNSAANAFGTTMSAIALPNDHKLSFASGIPTEGAGQLAEDGGSPEHLFIAGGGRCMKIRDGDQSEQWGIEPPVENALIPFTAEPVAFQQGENFKFWETFNSLGAGANLMHPVPQDQNTDDVHLFLETDPARLPPDGLSTACINVQIFDSHYAVVQRAFPDATNAAGTYQDLGTFAAGGQERQAGPPSAEQDWIVLDVMSDRPDAIVSFTIGFVGVEPPQEVAYPAVCTHVRECIVDDPVIRTTQRQPYGVGDIAQVRADQAELVDPDKGPSSQFIRQVADSLANDRLSSVPFEWRRLKIPKSSFTVGAHPGQDPWQHLTHWQITIQTREVDAIRVHVWIDNGSLFGGTGMQGEYKYLFRYKNSLTGSVSNPNKTPVVVKSSFRTGVQLSGLPQPSDPQVNQLEIFRTEGNGSIFFLNRTIASGGFAYLDRVSDYRGMAEYPLSAIRSAFDADRLLVLQDTAIAFDNIPPPDTMEDVAGPHLGRLFGTRDTAPGHGGRVYYTPPGRLEAWPDFLVVSGDNDPMQKVVIAAGIVLGFSQEKCWEIVGTGPFEARELFGVPGTRYPFSVVATPYGIIYLAADGVRRLGGASSELIAGEAILTLFRGEPGEGLAAFPIAGDDPQRVCAAFWNDEYFLTDNVTTLALNLATGAWREVGVQFTALFTERDTDKLLIGHQGQVLDWEVPGVVTDAASDTAAGTPVPFHVELPAIRPDAGLEEFIVQRLYVDCQTRGEVVRLSLFGHEHGGGGGPYSLLAPVRKTIEIPLCTPIGVGYVALNADLTDEIEVFGIEIDCHVPGDPNAT